MRKKILTIVTGVGLLSTTNVLAQTSEKNLEAAIQQLMEQTEALQKEVKTLRAELDQVKHKKKQVAVQDKPVSTNSGVSLAASSPSKLTFQKTASQEQAEAISHLLGSPVLTSPVLTLRSNFDASDLIVNYSTMNEDLRFLRQKKELIEEIGIENLPSTFRPFLILSGKVETQYVYQDPFVGDSNNAIDLSGVELDAYARVSPWASGFISLLYDASAFDPTLLGSGDPNNNGKLFVNRGFLTIGNLYKTPLYFTTGQMYLPFGRYSTYMLSNPLTKSVGRINASTALLGYATDDAFVSGYVYDGASNFGQSGVGGLGANIGYLFSVNEFNFQLGAGVVNNLADTQNAQSTGGSSFAGFSANPSTERLKNNVPAVNLNASAGRGPFTLVGEVIAATGNYAAEDLSFNGAGASPGAIQAELDYTFNIKERPASLALSYGQSWQALGLNLPQNSYTATFNISIWKNTIETLEFRHDVNYGVNDTAGGICPADGGGTTFCAVPQVGGTQNTLLGQIGVYF